MIPAIRAEARKLLTIRSTYVITGLALLLIGFIAVYGMGYKSEPILGPPGVFQSNILNCISIMQIFVAIVAMLLITHEYRYNTIMYALTSSNNRLKVLFAKFTVVTLFSAVVTILTLLFIVGGILLGLQLAGHELGTQNVDVYSVLWRSLAFVVSGALAGLVFGFLSRSIVFAIVAFFLLPTTIEPLLHSLLKVNSNYLPFSVQNQIIMPGNTPDTLSAVASFGVFMAYLVGAWIVASVLFVRRDAN